MTSSNLTSFTRWLMLATGAGDVVAGVMLACVPAAFLSLAGLVPVGAEAEVFLRWVGTFAAAVGAAYLFGAIGHAPGRLRATLGLTLIFRLATACFGVMALALGWLAKPWATVVVVNVGLVIVQGWLLAKGVGNEV